MEEVTADVVEVAGEMELEVEPGDMTEWWQQHADILMGEELLLVDEQRMVSGDGIYSW